MALTSDELRTQQAAKLDLLVAELMAAKRSGNLNTLDKALEALVDFRAATPFPDLQVDAAKARHAASEEIAETALTELAALADRASGAGAGFKAAAMVAESGKKELLFPALAAATARGLELTQHFQAALASVEATVGSIDELGEVPDAVKALKEAFDTLKEEITAVE